VAGPCEYFNEHLGHMKGGEFLDQLRECQLLRKSSSPWSLLKQKRKGLTRSDKHYSRTLHDLELIQ
jgi:hypothetical protein